MTTPVGENPDKIKLDKFASEKTLQRIKELQKKEAELVEGNYSQGDVKRQNQINKQLRQLSEKAGLNPEQIVTGVKYLDNTDVDVGAATGVTPEDTQQETQVKQTQTKVNAEKQEVKAEAKNIRQSNKQQFQINGETVSQQKALNQLMKRKRKLKQLGNRLEKLNKTVSRRQTGELQTPSFSNVITGQPVQTRQPQNRIQRNLQENIIENPSNTQLQARRQLFQTLQENAGALPLTYQRQNILQGTTRTEIPENIGPIKPERKRFESLLETADLTNEEFNLLRGQAFSTAVGKSGKQLGTLPPFQAAGDIIAAGETGFQTAKSMLTGKKPPKGLQPAAVNIQGETVQESGFTELSRKRGKDIGQGITDPLQELGLTTSAPFAVQRAVKTGGPEALATGAAAGVTLTAKQFKEDPLGFIIQEGIGEAIPGAGISTSFEPSPTTSPSASIDVRTLPTEKQGVDVNQFAGEIIGNRETQTQMEALQTPKDVEQPGPFQTQRPATFETQTGETGPAPRFPESLETREEQGITPSQFFTGDIPPETTTEQAVEFRPSQISGREAEEFRKQFIGERPRTRREAVKEGLLNIRNPLKRNELDTKDLAGVEVGSDEPVTLTERTRNLFEQVSRQSSKGQLQIVSPKETDISTTEPDVSPEKVVERRSDFQQRVRQQPGLRRDEVADVRDVAGPEPENVPDTVSVSTTGVFGEQPLSQVPGEGQVPRQVDVFDQPFEQEQGQEQVQDFQPPGTPPEPGRGFFSESPVSEEFFRRQRTRNRRSAGLPDLGGGEEAFNEEQTFTVEESRGFQFAPDIESVITGETQKVTQQELQQLGEETFTGFEERPVPILVENQAGGNNGNSGGNGEGENLMNAFGI